MNYIHLKTILFLVCLHSSIQIVNSAQCCSPDQYVLKKEKVCWDQPTNKTSAANLGCRKKFFLKEFDERNGSLVLIIMGKEVGTLKDQFCMTDVVTSNLTNSTTNLTIIRHVALVCTTEEDPNEPIRGYCMVVSVIFLAFTAFIYSFFEKLRDLFGKSIISFCISMAVGLAFLAILKLMAYSDMGWCAVRGFITYFALMSGYFWSNAIAIQILLCTRAPALFNAKRSFLYYSLYAWGIPGLLTICMLIVNFYPADHEKPGIGLNTCWFGNEKQRWYYMYGIMSILVIANISIFIYTATLIWRQSFSSTHIKVMRFKLCLMIRLLVLLGLFWVFEMISAVVEPHIVWVIVDVFNSLHGFFIFLVLVVLRPRVMKIILGHGYFFCLSRFVEKCLALVDDAEDDCVAHTEVAMTET